MIPGHSATLQIAESIENWAWLSTTPNFRGRGWEFVQQIDNAERAVVFVASLERSLRRLGNSTQRAQLGRAYKLSKDALDAAD